MNHAHQGSKSILRSDGSRASSRENIVGTFKEAYLEDILNCKTKSINDTVEEVLIHLQENYGQLISYKLIEHNDIVKKTTYHFWYPIATVFSVIEELLEFAKIIVTSYTQIQAVNISYIIIHRTGKFGLDICKWNHMTTVQKMWVVFKHFFMMEHRELRKTSGITIEDAGMHHANMLRNVVTGLQEVLQQEQAPTDIPTIIS